MDGHFLPSDISVMILRYLASSGCESSVFAMIEDMPFLKFYVPKQPLGMSKSEYMKLLGRPSFTPGLEDVLNDYGRSKNLVTEMGVKQDPSRSPITTCDSLVTQLKRLDSRLGEKSERISQGRVERSVCLADVGVCTDSVQDILSVSPVIVKSVTMSHCETQTDEVNEFEDDGDSRDLPLMFYNTLMSDSNLHQKLASVINEELTGPKNSKTDVLQKVCTKVESEINLDKFLNDLLKDGDGVDVILGLPPVDSSSEKDLVVPTAPNENSDGGLSNLFQDANSIIYKDIQDPGLLSTINTNEVQSLLQTTELSPANQPLRKDELSNVAVGSSSSKDSNSASTPKSQIPKKRIIPTPVAPPAKVNPVFETVVQERGVTENGQKYCKKETNVVIPSWSKLSRRSIQPRIPKSLETTEDLEAKTPEVLFPPKDVIPTVPTPPSVVVPPGSSNKRKSKLATPIKMTPEKASCSDVNFFHVFHDSQKPKGTPSSSVKRPKTMDLDKNSSISQKPTDQEPPIVLFSRETSSNSETPKVSNENVSNILQLIEVTPQLDSFGSSNFVAKETPFLSESVSPRLRRLIVSAQKARASTTQVNLVKKSFSTPRKKKHVRSLFFTTPPSLKGQFGHKSPAKLSTQTATTSFAASISQKRKRSIDDLKEEQPINKKCLLVSPEQEVDPDAYKSSAFPDRKFTNNYLSESMLNSAKRAFEAKIKPDIKKEKETDSSQVQQKCSKVFHALPEIPEESAESSLSAGVSSKHVSDSLVVTQQEHPIPKLVLVVHSPGSSEKTGISPPAFPSSELQPPPQPLENEFLATSLQTTEMLPASPPEEGECGDSNPPIQTCPHENNVKLVKSYHEKLLSDLFGPMTPDKHESSDSSQKSRKKSKARNSSESSPPKEKKESRKNKKSNKNKERVGETNEKEKVRDAEKKKEKYEVDSRIRSKRSPSKTPPSSATSNKRKSSKEDPTKSSSNSKSKNEPAKAVTPRNSYKNSKTEKDPVKKSKLELKATDKPEPLKCESSHSQRSRRSLDVASAKKVTQDAVFLSRGTSISPNSPIKNTSSARQKTNVSSANEKISASSLIEKNSFTLSSSASFRNITSKNIPEQSAVPSTGKSNNVPIFATPLKETFMPFSILPAPLGFPDPTPTKGPLLELSHGTHLIQNNALITPMKPIRAGPPNISPLIPKTPRIVIQEETESNSLPSYKPNDGLVTWTPSKFFGPPPTPGRCLFVDERSQMGYTPSVITLHAEGGSDQNEEIQSEIPLDLSSSPVAPHRLQQQALLLFGSDSSFESSDEKKNSPVEPSKKAAEMGKKDDAHFQIPVGAPKKTSPSVPATSKKPTVQASSYSGVVSNDLQNRPRSSVASSNSKSHGQEENMALHKKSESSETQKEEKHVKKSPAAKSLSPKKPESVQTNLKFLVEGVVKNLSMTEHKPLLGLAEVRRKSDTSIQTRGKPSGIRNLLKNIDLNHFLSKVHQPDLNNTLG